MLSFLIVVTCVPPRASLALFGHSRYLVRLLWPVACVLSFKEAATPRPNPHLPPPTTSARAGHNSCTSIDTTRRPVTRGPLSLFAIEQDYTAPIEPTAHEPNTATARATLEVAPPPRRARSRSTQ